MKKVYHIAFSYWSPMPGIITLAADDEAQAEALLREMSKDMKDVKIIEILDAALMPSFQESAEAMAKAVDNEWAGYPEDDEPIMKKPN